jgi:pyruvate,water dikinase
MSRLVPLVRWASGTGTGPGKDGVAPGCCTTPGAIPPLARPVTLRAGDVGFKAERLARALHAGLPVLPGWVVPVSASREVLRSGAAAVWASGVAAGRVAVLSLPLDSALEAELRAVVDGFGGRVIVRSSSPLEADPVWSGAFSSVTGVGCEDVAAAVRSCWASVFAPDPLRRLAGCGLPLGALELAVLVQPEIVPEAGGVARTEPGSVAVTVEGVAGHPGPLLSGWAEGARDGDLAGLIGRGTVANVADLARRVYAELGDDVIEWAACGGTVWLLQSQRGASRTAPAGTPVPLASLTPVVRDGMQALAALERGTRVPARPAVPGTAAGPLLACRPHQPAARDCRDAILLVDRPLPALAPLLFGARGVISRSGAAGSHLAEVARSLGVPMVTGCRPETVTGREPASGAWLAAINGGTGEVLISPARGRPRPPRGAPGGGWPARRR